MPGYISNMAQNQAAQPNYKPLSIDANKPWEYDYTSMDPKRNDGWTGTAPTGHYGGAKIGYGPQGYGRYDLHSTGEDAVRMQQYYTNQFQNDMPHLNDLLTNRMQSDVTKGMDQGIKNTQLADSRRGLLYGGLHAGNEGAVRAQAAGQMAQGKSDINQGLQSTLEGMQNNSIKAGIDWQQQQQSMQNAIYEQALARMAGTQKAFSSVGGAAGMGLGLYLSGGNPAGGYIGQQAGSQVF